MTDENEPFQVNLPVQWDGVDALPVLVANQFLIQVQGMGATPPEDILLSGGHVAPPVFIGPNQEQQAREFAARGAIPIRPIFRVSLSRSRAQELVEILQSALVQFDALNEGARN